MLRLLAGHAADPGTSSLDHLEENWATRRIELFPDEQAAIAACARDGSYIPRVATARSYAPASPVNR